MLALKGNWCVSNTHEASHESSSCAGPLSIQSVWLHQRLVYPWDSGCELWEPCYSKTNEPAASYPKLLIYWSTELKSSKASAWFFPGKSYQPWHCHLKATFSIWNATEREREKKSGAEWKRMNMFRKLDIYQWSPSSIVFNIGICSTFQ